jgi:hypothetical protein
MTAKSQLFGSVKWEWGIGAVEEFDCREHQVGFTHRTGSKLMDAMRYSRSDPAGFHGRFRLLADLVQNPWRTLSAIQQQPVREIGGTSPR